MKNLEPSIYRQRLVIEGKYKIKPTPAKLKQYMNGLSELAQMTIIYGPMVKNLAARVNPIHAGYESVMIWAESGVQVYTWNKKDFFTVDVYTCKRMDSKKVVAYTKKFFDAKEIAFKQV